LPVLDGCVAPRCEESDLSHDSRPRFAAATQACVACSCGAAQKTAGLAVRWRVSLRTAQSEGNL